MEREKEGKRGEGKGGEGMRRERRGGEGTGQDGKRGEEERGGQGKLFRKRSECEIGEGTKINTRYLHTRPNRCHDCVQYMLTF